MVANYLGIGICDAARRVTCKALPIFTAYYPRLGKVRYTKHRLNRSEFVATRYASAGRSICWCNGKVISMFACMTEVHSVNQ
jgi:hypothetical protein